MRSKDMKLFVKQALIYKLKQSKKRNIMFLSNLKSQPKEDL